MRKRLVFIFVSVLMLLCLPSLSTAKMSDEDFLELCKTGTPAEIIKAIKDGANVNATGEFGESPFVTVAMYNPNLDVLKVFLENGVSVNTTGSSMGVALHHAAENENIEITKFLLDAGVDVNAMDRWGGTALLYSTSNPNVEVMKLLIKAGADVNEVNEYGSSPLHLAVEKNNPNGTLVLLDAGADVNAFDDEDKRPIDYADGSFKKTEAYKRLKGLSDNVKPKKRLIEPKCKIIAANDEMRNLIIQFYNEHYKVMSKLENVLEKGAWAFDWDMRSGAYIMFAGYFHNTQGGVSKLYVRFILDSSGKDERIRIIRTDHFFDSSTSFTPGLPGWLEDELAD